MEKDLYFERGMEMDELKMNLTTKFMRGIINKLIRKKLGYDVDVLLNNVHVTSSDGKVNIRLDAEASISHAELLKLIKSIGLD